LDSEKHFEQLARWIEMESAAEAKRLSERKLRLSDADAERTGQSLLDLAISDGESGLAGRYLMTFVKRNRELRLPWNRLRVGSPVVVSETETGDNYQGVVSGKRDDWIQVALSEWPEGSMYRIDLAADEITRRRQLAAINQVRFATGRLGTLRKVLLGEREPKFQSSVDCTFFGDLDDSQKAAVEFALTASDVAVIHGPPGTGKTTTVVELIRQAVHREQTVLACAPSNTAADNLLEKMVDAGLNVVRLGHPARVAERLREYSLDLLVENDESMEVARDMLKEAEQLFRQAGRFTRAKPQRGAKQSMRREAKELKRGARLMEKQAIQHIIDKADVVCATTTVDSELLGDRQFDYAVIDEACQSTEPGNWVPILNAYRVILAGDHCQLPPTVVSRPAADEGFAISLLEQIVERYGDDVTRLLTKQYRMHEQIMRFSSDEFYDGELIADPSVAEHRLCDLPRVAESEMTQSPVMFIDTAGSGWEEELEPDGESRRNIEEGRLVLRKVKELRDSGLLPQEIAVIAPYAAQVRWLREHSGDRNVEVDTVDGFQGREKEAVVISLVRSNQKGEIGFLSDTRRMNVALTRARRKLIVIGDSATLGGNAFYASLLEYFEEIGAYRSVWEEADYS